MKRITHLQGSAHFAIPLMNIHGPVLDFCFLDQNIKLLMKRLNMIGRNIDPSRKFLRISRNELKVAPSFTRSSIKFASLSLLGNQ